MNCGNKKKICIIVSSLGKGGAQKASATVSKMLCSQGYNVHIVSVLNHIDYSYKGTLFNLGALKENDNSIIGRFKRMMLFKSYLKEHNFDVLIDSRSRPGGLKQFIISNFIYRKAKVIYIVGSYKLTTYLPKSKVFARFLYGKAYKLLAVSKEIKEKLEKTYHFKNVEYIYNALPEREYRSSSTAESSYVLAYGRLVDSVKNYTLLINAYKTSVLAKRKVKLVILGSGKDERYLKDLVIKLNLNEYITFVPFVSNPQKYVENAKMVCLTSRYEGFPMVLLESLSAGTPVVSVDCNSGPKEIVVNEYNGLLVENNNVSAYAEALNRMIEDEVLYNKCKANSKKSVEKFSIENISKQWNALIESI